MYRTMCEWFTYLFSIWFRCDWQNPDEDTEWNDILRAKGILPPKPKEAEITEQSIVDMMEKAIAQKQSGNGIDLQIHRCCHCEREFW